MVLVIVLSFCLSFFLCLVFLCQTLKPKLYPLPKCYYFSFVLSLSVHYCSFPLSFLSHSLSISIGQFSLFGTQYSIEAKRPPRSRPSSSSSPTCPFQLNGTPTPPPPLSIIANHPSSYSFFCSRTAG